MFPKAYSDVIWDVSPSDTELVWLVLVRILKTESLETFFLRRTMTCKQVLTPTLEIFSGGFASCTSEFPIQLVMFWLLPSRFWCIKSVVRDWIQFAWLEATKRTCCSTSVFSYIIKWDLMMWIIVWNAGWYSLTLIKNVARLVSLMEKSLSLTGRWNSRRWSRPGNFLRG